MFCVWGLFETSQTTDKKFMLQGYKESRLKSSCCKLYGCYNYLVCNNNWLLAYMMNDLFHTLCKTVVSILALTTDNFINLILSKVHSGCDRSAEDTYSPMSSDPTLAFVDGPCYLTIGFCICPLDYEYVLHIANFAILYGV
jgi:hypothetical protein